MEGTSWTNYGYPSSLATIQRGNSSSFDAYNNTDGDGPYEIGEGTPRSTVMFAALLGILFIGLLFCAAVAQQLQRSRQTDSPSQPQDGNNKSKRNEEIKDLLKVFEYPFNETDSESSDDEAQSITDLEAQRDGPNIDEDPATMEEESGAFSLNSHADCAICLGPFEAGQRVCEGNNAACVHNFHESCMTAWLLKHRECPVCRQEYLSKASTV